MQVSEWLDLVTTYSAQSSVVLQVFGVVFSTLLLNVIARAVLNRVLVRLRKTPTPWDDALVAALRSPLTVVIWLVGLALAARILDDHAHSVIFDTISTMRDVGIVTCVAWFMWRFLTTAEHNFVEHRRRSGHEVDETTVSAVAKLLRLSVLITAGLVIMQTLGYSISGVLAFGGVGGVAVGFASKDLLANFFGALMIYLDRPFAVGDWIRSPDRNIEGSVEHIGWRLTRIRTFDLRPLYVPNSTFTSIAVENPSRMTRRRIYETIGIRYQDADRMRAIVDAVHQMLTTHPEIDQEQTIIVNFEQFGPSSLNFFVYTFTRTKQWVKYQEVKQDVLLKIAEIIRAQGAELALPATTVHFAGPLAGLDGAAPPQVARAA